MRCGQPTSTDAPTGTHDGRWLNGHGGNVRLRECLERLIDVKLPGEYQLITMRAVYNNSVKVIAWTSATVAGLSFLGDWFAPDACLDFGGAFDYVHWRCSHDDDETLSYIDVPAYRLPSFQLFAGLLGLAVALQVMLRGPRAG